MTQKVLEDYLKLQYPFQVVADPDGGYVVTFPDLPGCMTQAETVEEIPAAAEDARRAWISAVYNDGEIVPLPSYPEEYSGKFVARVPRALHRQLAEEAERQSVSLNQHLVALLASGNAQIRLEHRLLEAEQRLSARLDLISEQVERLRFQMTPVSFGGQQRAGRSTSQARTKTTQPYQLRTVAS